MKLNMRHSCQEYISLEAKHIKDYSNSQLVMNQINEELQSQDENMATYIEAVKVLVK